MFNSLKKLFGGKEAESSPAPTSESTATVSGSLQNAPFLRREAVFDRHNRLTGHLFYLQHANAAADGDDARQVALDKILLDTLNASPAAWNTAPAFIPLNSASLELPGIERLKTANIILLIQLATDADAAILCETIDQLRQRGLQVGVFRQPRHAAFAKVIRIVDFAVIDFANNDPVAAREFSAAVRALRQGSPARLMACNVETMDEERFCLQWHYDFCHGAFATQATPPNEPAGDPHKALILNLMRLVQGDAENAEIAEAMKQDPVLSFRILRYLNSPALGLTHRIDSLSQALIILGRQRLTRWLAVLLFSVRDPELGDWLLVENALTRGRLMEVLGNLALPDQSHDPLFLTGIFSCLGRLLHRPLSDILNEIPVADEIRQALMAQGGPYAPLLAVAEASEAFDHERMAATARDAGIDPEAVNGALLAATAWASEVTEYWQ